MAQQNSHRPGRTQRADSAPGEGRGRKRDVIRDRHTGEPLLLANLKTGGTPPGVPYPLREMYLGVRHPIDLRTADFRGVDLRGADVTGKDLSDADLTGAKLDGLKFDVWTRFPEGFDPLLLGAIEAPPDMGGQNCDQCDLSGMHLANANFAGGSAVETNLTGADLSRANFRGANLTGARLDDADLSGADLRAARCSGASFRNARLVGTVLSITDLTDADLSGADLTGATWDKRTRWPSGFLPSTPLAEPLRASSRDELAARFKALGDPVRLTLLGLLLRDEYTGEELADTLGVTEPTISHHMARLRDAELITVRAEGTRRLYSTTAEQVDAAIAGLAARLIALTNRSVDPDVYARKVLASFFDGDRLKTIPARQKKQRVVLERLVQEFAPGVRYTEREVNAILLRFHEDCATLRRLLIAERLLARDRDVYWRNG